MTRIALRPLFVSLALCASHWLCACAATPDARTMPPMDTTPIASVLPALLEDAARRSGASSQQLRVVAVEAVTWRDGSIGCPQPGRLYPQVLVPGHRVRIATTSGSDAPLDYHLDARGGWVHCPPERAVPPLPRGADPRI